MPRGSISGIAVGKLSRQILPEQRFTPDLSLGCALLGSPVIQYEDIIHDRSDKLSEGLVFGVNQVFITILVALETENEAMGETLVVFFGANVGSPFEGANLFDLLRQQAKRFHELINLGLSRRGLELESDHMHQLPLANGFGRGIGSLDGLAGEHGDDRDS